jgi:hypothetical protein
MRRAFFLAVGIFLMIAGGEMLCIDEFELAPSDEREERLERSLFNSAYTHPGRSVEVKAAWPWMALAGGGVIAVYSYLLASGGKK